jgi:hypothetical protein
MNNNPHRLTAIFSAVGATPALSASGGDAHPNAPADDASLGRC